MRWKIRMKDSLSANLATACLVVLAIAGYLDYAVASLHQDRLIRELFLLRKYDFLSRPVERENETVTVNFGLTLNILVTLSDMDQMFKTNGYLDLNWTDPRLKWNISEFGGIDLLRLPIDKLWQPDVALTSAMDANYLPSYKSNALIYNNGEVLWVPPFIFLSGCDTQPLLFPFDRQTCTMVFRSLTYNAKEVDFNLIDPYMKLKDYNVQPSGSWHIHNHSFAPMKILYRMNYRKSGPVPDVSVQLDLTAYRMSQFYVITFLLPCVCIAFLTVFLFYLPTASGEKLCLAISILFSIVVFLLILIEVLPPSDQLPLMTKFLLFTFVCNLISVIITTITVNWSFRNPKTHTMPPWIRYVFLQLLPPIVRVKRPKKPEKKKLFKPTVQPSHLKSQKSSLRFRTAAASANGSKPASVRFTLDDSVDDPQTELIAPAGSSARYPAYGVIAASSNFGFTESRESTNSAAVKELTELGEYLSQFPGYDEALLNVAFIAKNMEDMDEESDVADDWKFVVLVVDRLLLIIFFIGNAFGSGSILLNSEHLWTDPVPTLQI